MQTQIFLIAPADADLSSFADQLAKVLERSEVSALLLQRGQRAENAYKEYAKAIIPVAQAAGAAVLLEGAPGLVKMLGADGLHIPDGDVDATRDAVAALHPGQIVGVGNVDSRDQAMTLGELDVDYILFGPLSGAITPAARDMALWWAETMEIPGVLSDPEATAVSFDAAGCEFIGLSIPALEAAR